MLSWSCLGTPLCRSFYCHASRGSPWYRLTITETDQLKYGLSIMLHLHLVDSATDGPGFQLSYDHLFQASCFGIEPTSCFGGMVLNLGVWGWSPLSWHPGSLLLWNLRCSSLISSCERSCFLQMLERKLLQILFLQSAERKWMSWHRRWSWKKILERKHRCLKEH